MLPTSAEINSALWQVCPPFWLNVATIEFSCQIPSVVQKVREKNQLGEKVLTNYSEKDAKRWNSINFFLQNEPKSSQINNTDLNG